MNQPVISKARIVRDLAALGVAPGDILAVHSSLKAIGWVEGGPDAVVDALMETLTPEGTLLMPAMNRPVPVWLHAQTPSAVGAVSEAFRRRQGVARSLHPTHSACAWGKHADRILAGHPAASALGVDSPFHRLAKLGGRVLMLGATYTSCSLVHVAEAIAKVPYLGIFYPGYEVDLRARLANGVELTFHPFENPGDSACFEVVERRLRAEGRLIEGRIGQAASTLALGTDILRAALECLLENPESLVYDPDKPTSAVRAASLRTIRETGWRLLALPPVV
ncbi:AAC(3) family N-acetyltransferase [bacterium]|nr:AAC(3) family N-acetyltransferase [bacterium]